MGVLHSTSRVILITKMENNQINLKKILIQRLVKRGIEPCLIPGFVRVLTNSILDETHINLHKVNRRLNYLGWYDVELDYHTLQLAVACFGEEDFCNLRYISPTYSNGFASTFK